MAVCARCGADPAVEPQRMLRTDESVTDVYCGQSGSVPACYDFELVRRGGDPATVGTDERIATTPLAAFKDVGERTGVFSVTHPPLSTLSRGERIFLDNIAQSHDLDRGALEAWYDQVRRQVGRPPGIS